MSVNMKKVIKKKITNCTTDAPNQMVNEPEVVYRSVKVYATPKLKDFTYNEFKKIADKASFTKAEWASILHVSERTLQRYAKSNGVFAAINAERAMQLDGVIKEGKKTFGTIDLFYGWIKRSPYMVEGNLSFQSLTTNEGIQKIMMQLGRIQHGILA